MTYFNTIISTNEPVIRPMFYEFFDENLNDVNQFLLGNDLMVIPIVNANESYAEKDIYFPDKYFDFRFGYAITEIGMKKYPIYESPLLLFIRAGSILAIHQNRVGLAEYKLL